ncbi:hypothetical protein [Nocardia mangyaensis]|uniref:hypothetical protein n=1 Tax=Nocardia mangyaensis TaxID=2213200 RepID=UPI0012EB2646|nr:hypothetical protein [Nocardia mangyaensis]
MLEQSEARQAFGVGGDAARMLELDADVRAALGVVNDQTRAAPRAVLPQRTRKTLRAQMVRAEVGGHNPYSPAVVFYVDNVPALSWSDIGGVVPARTSPSLQAIAAACFPMRHTPRVDRRREVLQRLLDALEQWSSTGQPLGGSVPR